METITSLGAINPATPTIATSRGEECWFALYTCANHEKRVATHLEARKVDYFLPLYSSVRRWKDRRVRLDMPLFPGYLFVRIALSARLRVLEAPGVVRLIGFNGQPYPLPKQEIESLRAGVLNAARIEPHPHLNIGSRVRVVRGPLRGAEGIFVRKKNVYRMILTIDVIARSAAVEVDAHDIEKIF